MGMSASFKKYQKGLNAAERSQIKEIANRIEQETIDKAFLCMLAIPLVILENDYWQKTAKKRIPVFIDDVMSLYQSVTLGNVTYEELAEDLKNSTGIVLDAKWLKEGVNRNECKN